MLKLCEFHPGRHRRGIKLQIPGLSARTTIPRLSTAHRQREAPYRCRSRSETHTRTHTHTHTHTHRRAHFVDGPAPLHVPVMTAWPGHCEISDWHIQTSSLGSAQIRFTPRNPENREPKDAAAVHSEGSESGPTVRTLSSGNVYFVPVNTT